MLNFGLLSEDIYGISPVVEGEFEVTTDDLNLMEDTRKVIFHRHGHVFSIIEIHDETGIRYIFKKCDVKTISDIKYINNFPITVKIVFDYMGKKIDMSLKIKRDKIKAILE